MGYARREYTIGGAPDQDGPPIVITMGDNWREDHYITLPPAGGLSSSSTIDNVIIHVRNRADDAEPVLEGTSDPANKVTVSRPSPDLLKVSFNFDGDDTRGLTLTAPDGGRIPGTPSPPQPTPGVGLMAIKAELSSGEVYTVFRRVAVTQPELVF